MAKQISRQSITCAATGTTEVAGSAISANKGVISGILCMVKVVTPNVNSITFTIRLYDRNAVLLWASAALAENSGAPGYAIPVNIPLTEKEYFSAQASGTVGAGGTVTIDADYLPDLAL